MYLTTFFPLQLVQSLADYYACRVKKGGSIPEVKDGEMRETSSELEEASFVLQADALQAVAYSPLMKANKLETALSGPTRYILLT